MDSSTLRRTSVLAAGVILAMGAVGCTTVQGSQGASGASSSTPSVTATSTPVVDASASSDSSDPTTEDSARHSSSGKTTTRKNTTTTTATKASAPGPKVESLTVVRKPSCPVVGTPDAPFSSPGVDIIIAWKVSGAPGAAIGVDNPGVYGAYGSDYGVSGQLELAFPCSGSTGSTSHTYTVWPQGAKGVSKTITVSAVNNP